MLKPSAAATSRRRRRRRRRSGAPKTVLHARPPISGRRVRRGSAHVTESTWRFLCTKLLLGCKAQCFILEDWIGLGLNLKAPSWWGWASIGPVGCHPSRKKLQLLCISYVLDNFWNLSIDCFFSWSDRLTCLYSKI